MFTITKVQSTTKKKDVAQVLYVGLIVSSVGMLLAFFASEATVVLVLLKALGLPQGVEAINLEHHSLCESFCDFSKCQSDLRILLISPRVFHYLGLSSNYSCS